MVWDRRLAGYYAWMFPEPGDVVNIGLTIPEHAPEGARLKELFQELLDEHWGLGLRDAEAVGKWMGHPAVITHRIGPVAEAHALWIGEAARLVSPGTVEGIGLRARERHHRRGGRSARVHQRPAGCRRWRAPATARGCRPACCRSSGPARRSPAGSSVRACASWPTSCPRGSRCVGRPHDLRAARRQPPRGQRGPPGALIAATRSRSDQEGDARESRLAGVDGSATVQAIRGVVDRARSRG